MLFTWLKRRRRRRILAEPLPAAWQEVLEAVPHVPVLARARADELSRAVRIFLAETEVFGHSGLEVADRMLVTVAGLASLLTPGLAEFYFDNVGSVILHPTVFTLPQRTAIAPEAVLEEEIEELGAAYHRGSVLLAWEEVEEDLCEPWCGRNL